MSKDFLPFLNRAVYIGSQLVFTGFGRKRRSTDQDYESDFFDSNEELDSETESLFSDDTMLISDGRLDKRFLMDWKPYWQVCGAGDDLACVNHLHNAAVTYEDHRILSYYNALESSPSHIYTRDETKTSTIEEALIKTCLKEEEQ